MAAISTADFLTLVDSIAKQAEILQDAVGTTGAEPDTSGYGADQNVTRILAYADREQEIDLLAAAQAALGRVLSANALPRLLGKGAGLVGALNAHLAARAGVGINTWMLDEDLRAHYLLHEVMPGYFHPQAIFPPVVDPIAHFDVTGAGAGTYTHDEAIDTTQYGKANLVLETTSAIGTGNLEAHVTCQKVDGTTEVKDVTVPNSSSSGTEIDVGTHDTDMYVDVTTITVTGGVNGDAFKIKSELERVIAL